MATIGDVPIEIRTGDTCSIVVSITDSTGAAVNVTGRTYRAQIRYSPDTSILASFTCVITNAAGGVVTCTMSATTTASLPVGRAQWDFEETNGDVVNTLFGGLVTITADVTK